MAEAILGSKACTLPMEYMLAMGFLSSACVRLFCVLAMVSTTLPLTASLHGL